MLAVLEFLDFIWLWLIVTFAGGSAVYARTKTSDAARIKLIEAKIDLILKHLGLNYEDDESKSNERDQ